MFALFGAFGKLTTGQATLRTGQATLRTGQATLRAGQATLRTGQALRHSREIDPTLLARSDPAPLESGCSICRPPGKDHAQFELRAGAVQVIVVDRTFRHSLVHATDQGAADTAGVRLLPR